jgi:accessory gene regulator protein AgrB
MKLPGGYMEPFILYGLVIVFFLLLALFVAGVLLNHPYAESAQQREAGVASDSHTKIAYGVLSSLLVLFIVMAFLHSKQAARGGSS